MSDPDENEIALNLTASGRIDKVLAADLPDHLAVSRSRLRALIEGGAVTVDGASLANPSQKVRAGAMVTLLIPEVTDSAPLPQNIPLDVVFEDDALIVVNKPAGMVVHPAPGAPDGTLVNALMHHCGDSLSGIGGERRPGIVHRIDKDTSGLLVVAKSDLAHQGLSTQFAAHSVDREYRALSFGVPERASARLAGIAGVSFEGPVLKIEAPIARHRADRKKMAVGAEGRHAVTRAQVLEPFAGQAALISCRLETGRTHQIRVHMAHVGHALIGDPVYAGRRKVGQGLPAPAREAIAAFPRQALHALRLGFVHPVTGETLTFISDLPPDFAELLRELRENSQD
ncbi:23S rRNA pseudouridine1911/1915/1917 synthase [Rubricella aquisinus]|uniref:Pseudouridine synthase n=1 Tax=Rubricella aquisinus TaxID=2028108 RepID=A0A840X6R5_9RHOB|nr:RluA family pseudouridine synthase [Rubricella aquisinus]MBB5516387.1 23S rRNA pseudouridine1911/1915/1917 synthase [Rubricella aquisinus]